MAQTRQRRQLRVITSTSDPVATHSLSLLAEWLLSMAGFYTLVLPVEQIDQNFNNELRSQDARKDYEGINRIVVVRLMGAHG